MTLVEIAQLKGYFMSVTRRAVRAEQLDTPYSQVGLTEAVLLTSHKPWETRR